MSKTSRLFPVCVVRTADDAIKFFPHHEPIPAKNGGHVTVNLKLDSQTVSLNLCKRCGLTYVQSESIVYEPSPGGVVSPQEGHA